MGRRKKTRVAEEEEEEEEEDIEIEDDEFQQNQDTNIASSSTQKSLYEILGVERTASHQEIRKAYHKLALRLHPDKNPGDEDAKEKFQQLQKVISILGDEEKRALYDQTGCVDDVDLAEDVDQNLQEFFFRSFCKKVTEAYNEEFQANYRGSESEKKDLIDLFKQLKGNMSRLFCDMLCSDPKLDSHRFKDILDEAISEGELKSTKTYEKWAKHVAKTTPPTSPLKRKKRSKDMLDGPYTMFAQRQKDWFDSQVSSLENKYGDGAISEPSEEEFQAARRRLESTKKKYLSKKESMKKESKKKSKRK